MENGVCFPGLGNDRARADYVTLFNSNVCVPFLFCVKGINADTS